MAKSSLEAATDRPRALAPARAPARLLWAAVPEMQTIRVLHCNTHGDGWTADSPDLKGWNVVSSSFGESKKRAEEAVRAQLASDGAAGDEPQISHHIACSR